MIWINRPFLDSAFPRRSASSLDATMSSTSDLTWNVEAMFSDVASAHAMAAPVVSRTVPATVRCCAAADVHPVETSKQSHAVRRKTPSLAVIDRTFWPPTRANG